MRPLASPDTPRLLLSFDFDGTMHHPGDAPPVHTSLFKHIRALRDHRDAVWGINTGRSMNHVVEGLIESQFPFVPDWVIAKEREIWFPNQFGRWLAKDDWNKTCHKEHKRFFRKTRKLLRVIRREIEEHTGAIWIEQPDEPAAMKATSDEEMDWIVDRIRELAADQPLLHWQRNTIWLRFSHRDYHKGTALQELGRFYGIAPADTFAIGDSHNDHDMLAPAVAGMIACPANAVDAIKEQVTNHDGFVSPSPHSIGCIEALRHFFKPKN